MKKIKGSKFQPRLFCLRLIARLLGKRKIIPFKGCWEWQGYCDEEGYGQIKVNGMAKWVHRISFAVYVDEIPAGETVDHKCFNPRCFRPDHLQLLSHAANSARKQSCTATA